MSDLLVEYNLEPGDQGYSPRPTVFTSLMGHVVFVPNPKFDDRLVIACDTQEGHKELLQNGNLGTTVGSKRVLVVPPDLMSSQEEARVVAVIERIVGKGGIDKKELRKMIEEIVEELVPGMVVSVMAAGNNRKEKAA